MSIELKSCWNPHRISLRGRESVVSGVKLLELRDSDSTHSFEKTIALDELAQSELRSFLAGPEVLLKPGAEVTLSCFLVDDDTVHLRIDNEGDLRIEVSETGVEGLEGEDDVSARVYLDEAGQAKLRAFLNAIPEAVESAKAQLEREAEEAIVREAAECAVTVEQVAIVCHEANRGLQAVLPAEGVPVAPAWDDLTGGERNTVRDGVVYAATHPTATPAEMHGSWLRSKRADGWVYGPVKDTIAKTHPCLVPYDELPFENRVKDDLFRAVVAALRGAR